VFEQVKRGRQRPAMHWASAEQSSLAAQAKGWQVNPSQRSPAAHSASAMQLGVATQSAASREQIVPAGQSMSAAHEAADWQTDP
jgi:hypothetical protein